MRVMMGPNLATAPPALARPCTHNRRPSMSLGPIKRGLLGVMWALDFFMFNRDFDFRAKEQWARPGLPDGESGQTFVRPRRRRGPSDHETGWRVDNEEKSDSARNRIWAPPAWSWSWPCEPTGGVSTPESRSQIAGSQQADRPLPLPTAHQHNTQGEMLGRCVPSWASKPACLPR
ncbi:hypothetical protein GGTG_13640 [Gaeumannomyces tritici R3-111a-1]|uniref:Uncharacterized protein n=1 Tax=Gaeumannomyces tritici (strain R3-111a-1) TaxID=644352 RepID=J3PJF9_GAET3|nr:hypothetical protein GGTG_13640 [Gaeumannomyces tritici R3-111a-1]EJT68789.1 hypothetical protein GGTG_13640 [Gaeumannomyces tritici R3-111a-1]